MEVSKLTIEEVIVPFEFIVTIGGIFQMRGGLTQATTFLIRRYGTLDAGIDAGARILPESLPVPMDLALESADAASAYGSPRHPSLRIA